MRRRNIDEPCVARDRLDDDALAVDGDRAYARAHGFQQQPGWRVAWLLDGGAVTRAKQYARDQVYRLLSAGSDGDSVRIGLDRSGDCDMPGDCGAQARVTGRISIGGGPD